MYIICPSNTIAPEFPNNKTSDFTISLPHTLNTPTSENWELSLLQIHLPITFYNVEDFDEVLVLDNDGSTRILQMNEGFYENPKDLAIMMTEKSQDFFSVHWSQSFALHISDNVKQIVFSDNLSRLLGLPRINVDKDTTSDIFTFDPFINHKVILIHCSLIKEIQVNDEHWRILQSLILEKPSFSATLGQAYISPEYCRIQGTVHSSVSFRITDLCNRPIRFRSGSVVLILEFRHE